MSLRNNTIEGDKVTPTEHTAKSASTPKIGLFATLRALLHAQGSGTPSRTLLATPLITLCAFSILLALSAGVAQAEPPKLVLYGVFGTSPVVEVNGVAVDQSSSDVYITGLQFGDSANIGKFGASGKQISPPSPFGEGSGGYSGTAVNPLNGHLYVLETHLNEESTAFEQAIVVYDPSTGARLSSFAVPSSPSFGFLGLAPAQIATDAAGNVYVPDRPFNEVLEYSESGTLLQSLTGAGAGALKEPSGVAVDAAGNVWVADRGDNRIEELSPSGSVLTEIKSEGVGALAVDASDDVFALVHNESDFCGSLPPPCAHVVEYSSAGAQLADVGAGSIENLRFEAFFGVTDELALNEASGRLYVTDGAKELVWIYGPPLAPVVGRESVAEVGTSEAKLGALINPGGIETTYRFEYLTEAEFQANRESFSGVHPAIVVPFPEGSVGEGVTSRAVWAAASGLSPGTTYHYRVIATNELGTVTGPDQAFTTLTAAQAVCPNEEFRGGFSVRLPDCRAYEPVTAPTRTAVETTVGGLPAADGDAVAYRTNDPLPGAPTGADYYIATRGVGGWSSEDVIPLESYSEVACEGTSGEGSSTSALAYSAATFSSAIVEYGGASRASGGTQTGHGGQACNAEGLQVVPGEPVGYQNLLLRDNATGAYRLINAPPPGVTPADAHFKGASPDLTHVVFTEESPLGVPGASYGVENLFEWDEGALRVLSVLPGGTPVVGASLPNGANAISEHGSHILFTYGGALYDRIDGQRTVQIDESQGGAGPSGGGSFAAASADGSKVFFLDQSRLTADSTAAAGEPDLYECDLPEGASKCELHDLTVAKAGEHADVVLVSALGSEESSYVYFTARGVLAANKREHTDVEGKTVLEGAESGQNNLYVWHEGTMTFIATLTSQDTGLEHASPAGTWFAFNSVKSLTGYENIPSNGVAEQEAFLYSAASNQLICASCNPSGEAPIAGGGPSQSISVGSFVPYTPYPYNGGRLFFQTTEALVPSDTNGQPDVYEYEDGHLYLISSGTSSYESTFLGAGEGGHDVFFRSRQALVPQDTQEGMDAIYDARVDGGFPAPASPPACTTADACRTPVSPQPSIYGAPASQTFSGLGNLAPPETKPKAKPKAKPVKCKQGLVKNKKGKCVRKKSKKQAKRVSHNRRGK